MRDKPLHALEKSGTESAATRRRPQSGRQNSIVPCKAASILLPHFQKSAIRRRNTFSRTSEIHDSRAAFLKSLKSILPRMSQGLQIGGTRLECSDPLPGANGGGHGRSSLRSWD